MVTVHKNAYKGLVSEVKKGMRWPHKLDIVCTGRGAHKQAALVQMWMDKATGAVTILGLPVSRNEHNIAPRKIEDRYREIDGEDHVTCNRCNYTRTFDPEGLGRLLLETAFENKTLVDISYADDLIPFALQAAQAREKRDESEDLPTQWQNGDWQNDPTIEPPYTAAPDYWRAHAGHLNLNVEGMDRWQIIRTVRYYRPFAKEPHKDLGKEPGDGFQWG